MKNVFLILVILVGVKATAQQKPSASITPEVNPVFTTVIAKRSSGDWSKELVKALIDSPLVVKDQTGKRYPVVRFSFNYFFVSVYVDSETKQRKERKDYRFAKVDGSLLSEVWRSSIKDNIRNGDELFFNDVLIRMPNGKLRYASDLTIKVK